MTVPSSHDDGGGNDDDHKQGNWLLSISPLAMVPNRRISHGRLVSSNV